MSRVADSWFHVKATVIALSLSGCLAGCAYHGESKTDIDNPAVQKFAWFSFVDGHDIREACAAQAAAGELKAPARYRLIYNGQYEEQLRVYEIDAAPSGGGNLHVRAKGHTNLADWWIRDTADLLAPWRWRESTAALSPAEMAQFRQLLGDSGFGSGAPQGLRLPSRDFYWVAAGCEAGQFHFYAWRAKGGRLDAAKFQDFLLRHDGTGLAFRPPHVLDLSDSPNRPAGGKNGRNPSSNFTLQVRGEGIGGLANAF
jgi:hypothetical protein